MEDGHTITCPECGARFVRKGGRQMFCSPAHKVAFYNLQTTRGTVIGPLLATARLGGRYKGADRELAAYARREADALINRWIIEDREAGRDAALIVADKMARCWRAADVPYRSAGVG